MVRALLLVLLLPPINLVIFALAGVILSRYLPRVGRAIALTATIALLLLAVPAVSGVLITGLERNLPTDPPPNDPPGAIVVLGGESLRTLSHPDGIIVGPMTLERLRTAANLARRTGLPVLVSGGIVIDEIAPVGTVMAASLAADFGIPVRWTEDRSRDTWENARFSADILRAEGIRSIYVVTHAWHMRRALIAFADTGLTVTAAPTPLRWSGTPSVSDLIPRASSWAAAYIALHEWVGALWYERR